MPDLTPDHRLEAAHRLARHVAQHLDTGIALRLWDGRLVPLGPGAENGPVVAITTPRVLTRLLRRPKLTTLVELLAAGDLAIENGTLLDLAARRGQGTRGLFRKVDKLLLARSLWPFLRGAGGSDGTAHAFAGEQASRPEQGRDDKALVQFHYDLSNAFYSLFLDPEMVYSCAYFEHWEADLAGAQRAKLDMVCRKLRLRPGETMLDIGCGWGGLICHAARHYGVRAHGVTLSQAQFDVAREKV